jgi:hypothetical protein
MILEIKLEGLEDVISRINKDIEPVLDNSIYTGATEYIQPPVSLYPPDFPGNTYQRTFNLQQGWNTHHTGTLQTTVSNQVDYGPYVQGDEQWALHASHGWQKYDVVAEGQFPALADYVFERIKALYGV